MDLTPDETMTLLDEIENLVSRLDASHAGNEKVEQIELALDSLEDAPYPSIAEHLPQIQGWVDALVDEDGPEEIEEIRALLFEEMSELRSLVEAEGGEPVTVPLPSTRR